MALIVRRRKLGMSSAKGISDNSQQHIQWARHDLGVPLDPDGVYIRWGCTANLPDQPGRVVINEAASIHRVTDKTGFRRIMQEHGLCPPTWFNPADIPRGEYPVIVRSRNHAQGRGLWVCKNITEVKKVWAHHPDGYINKLINKVREFRVFVHQGRVVWVAEKTPADPQDVAWNVAQGGRFDNVKWGDWNMAVIKNALAVHALTGLHFSGVDVMVDTDGQAWCVEANSAPSQTSPYRQLCVAKAFDWMMENKNFAQVLEAGGRMHKWKDVIHPGVFQNNGRNVAVEAEPINPKAWYQLRVR